MKFYLYSSLVRSRLELRAVYLDGASDDIQTLKNTNAWRSRACVITDSEKNIIESNGIDAHPDFVVRPTQEVTK